MLEKKVNQKKVESRRNFLKYGSLSLLSLAEIGCGGMGSPPFPTGVTDFKGSQGIFSGRGQIFNCRFGNFDVAHGKKFGRRTNKYAAATYHVIKKRGTKINFNGKTHKGEAQILSYPFNWDNLNPIEKEKITREVSIELGAYFAHCNSICYEASGLLGGLFGASSGFSWEDLPSDSFGGYVAKSVINPDDNFNHSSFNKRLSHALNDEFNKLGGIQSASVVKQAYLSVKGKWCNPSFFGGRSIMRNISFAQGDGMIKTCVQPLPLCKGIQSYSFPESNLDIVDRSGFKINIRLSGNNRALRKMKELGGKSYVNPRTVFPKLQQYLKTYIESIGDTAFE